MTFTVDSTDDEPDDDPGDGECASADGDCTLRAAVEEANATNDDVVINLPADTYTLTTDTQIDVTNTDHAISIEGDGADTTIIDGNETTLIFDVVAGADLSIHAVTLQDAASASHGGAVDNRGTFTATNSVFRDNEVTDGDGGALENDGTVTITDSSFLNNTAEDEAGAIDNDDIATLIITGTLFEGNTAPDAGAIENEGDLTITGSTFRNNGVAAGGDGGAMVNSSDSLSIDDSLFEGNTADEGGAIDNSGTVDITNTVFRENEAATETEGGGGAINTGSPDGLVVSGSVFDGNASGFDGGAVWIGGAAGAEVDATTFLNNTAGSDGGAIRNWNDLTITSSAFEANSAGSDDVTESGGAIYNSDTLTVTDSTFRDNVAPADDSYGGAIENDGGTTDLIGSTLVGNDAHEGGGLSSRAGFVRVTNTTISGNTADEGAGVYAGVAASMTLTHVTVARNTAAVQGGGIHNPDSEINVDHTLIAENDPQNCSGTDIGSAGHNVTDDDSCTLLFDGESGDQTDVADARISDLGDYGGNTQVHALLVRSPAIDVAESGDEDEDCFDAEGQPLNEDQRGAPRPVDGDDSGTAFCDAGAFEFVGPTDLQLVPADATNETDTEHTVTATVTDSEGAPVEDIEVPFSVQGANSASGSDVTDANGEASFTYTGENVGDDTITAFADADDDGTQDEGEPSDTASKTWVEPDETIRLWGPERWSTAIQISRDRFPGDGSASTVVLARGDDPNGYADALAGTPLSECLGAPLLITPPDRLLSGVAGEIRRVLGDSGHVVLLGLTDALDEDVEQTVRDLGYTTERIGGAERIATSIEVAERIEADCYRPDNVLIARGFDFADALAGGAAAASNDGVVVLNHDDQRDEQTENYIDDHGDADLYALGGQIASQYPEAEGLFGATRIETAVEVATEFFDGPTTVGVARAFKFPDSLTGGAHIGERAGPMLLTHDASQAASSGETIASAPEKYLCDNADTIETAYVYGGVVAISAETGAAVDDRIRGEGC